MDKDITGLMVYYYEVCKRKLWYFTNDIQLEENNSNVILGKLLEENTYTRDEKKINIGGVINIDFIRSKKILHEAKTPFLVIESAKKEYRKFKIRCKDTPDDFSMMREVIERRYSKLADRDFPDVILIDGGLGQINSAGEVLEKLGKIHLSELLSLAKRDEEIYSFIVISYLL